MGPSWALVGPQRPSTGKQARAGPAKPARALLCQTSKVQLGAAGPNAAGRARPARARPGRARPGRSKPGGPRQATRHRPAAEIHRCKLPQSKGCQRATGRQQNGSTWAVSTPQPTYTLLHTRTQTPQGHAQQTKHIVAHHSNAMAAPMAIARPHAPHNTDKPLSVRFMARSIQHQQDNTRNKPHDSVQPPKHIAAGYNTPKAAKGQQNDSTQSSAHRTQRTSARTRTHADATRHRPVNETSRSTTHQHSDAHMPRAPDS